VSFLFIATIGQTITKLLLGATAIFLILLVLVQRGRGGGLAGALGGMGGSSAFGAKAGDIFTKITVVAAAFWILLCMVSAKLTPSNESRINTGSAISASPLEEGSTSEDGASTAADSVDGQQQSTANDTDAAGEQGQGTP